MIEILRTTGVDEQDLRFISELYWNQTAVVEMEQSTSEDMQIRRGVRQGFVLSPLLFNLYSETICREALDGVQGGIKINGTPINNIRYADDIIVNVVQELQSIIDSVVYYSEMCGLHLNVSKTKLLVFSKTLINAHLRVKGQTIEQVTSIKYLGANINSQGDPKREILSRNEQARKIFISMNYFSYKTRPQFGIQNSNDHMLRLLCSTLWM